MKHLFVMRHGDHIRGALTEESEIQIRTVADRMKEIVGEMNNGFYLLTSTAPRAIQTADVIANALGIKEYAKDERLRTSSGQLISSQHLQEIDGMIAPYTDTNDAVAIVTHYEIVGEYPRYVAKKLFGTDKRIFIPGRGEAIHFNLEAKTHQTF